MEPFNISKHLGRCVLFRASCKLAPLSSAISKPNQAKLIMYNLGQGRIQGAIVPPKTYESNFIHHVLYNSENNIRY